MEGWYIDDIRLVSYARARSNRLALVLLLVVSVGLTGCFGDGRHCMLRTASESFTEQADPTYQNLTQEDVDSYPVLVDVLEADGSVEVDCDHQEEVWTYLNDQGYASTNNTEDFPVAWVGWDGKQGGIYPSTAIE